MDRPARAVDSGDREVRVHWSSTPACDRPAQSRAVSVAGGTEGLGRLPSCLKGGGYAQTVSAFTPDRDRLPQTSQDLFLRFTAFCPSPKELWGHGPGSQADGFRRAAKSRGPPRLRKVFLFKGRGGRSEAPL